MKRGKKLLMLLLVLAALAGATAAASRISTESGAEEETATTVFSLDPEAVTQISWDYSEPLSFTATENGWVYDGDEAFPVDETYLEVMLEALTEVSSTKTIEAPENMDQYGLEVPVCEITVTAEESHTLYIGQETSVGGQRYFSNGDGNAYLVDASLIDCFRYGLYDVLLVESLPSVSELTGMEVTSGAGSYTIAYLENSGLAYSDEYVWFMDGKALDTNLTKSFVNSYANMSLTNCVDYAAEDLSVYGLEEPAASVTILDGGEAAFTLDFGQDPDGGCYMRLKNSRMVYQVEDTLVDTLCYTTYADLQPEDVLLMDWDTVKSVTVTLDGEAYKIIKSTAKETDDEGNVTEKTVWKLNGEEVDFDSVIDVLDDLDSDGYGTGITPERSPEIAFTFTRDTADFQQVELVFYPYNSSSCLVTLNGESTVTAAREDVVELVETVSGIMPD